MVVSECGRRQVMGAWPNLDECVEKRTRTKLNDAQVRQHIPEHHHLVGKAMAPLFQVSMAVQQPNGVFCPNINVVRNKWTGDVLSHLPHEKKLGKDVRNVESNA